MATAALASDILVVDDETSSRDAIARALQGQGHSCTTADTGAEAFSLARNHPYDLMLMNWRLPDTDGGRLMGALREQGLQTPTIVLSAQPSLATALDALCCEASDYLPKPVKSELLLERVRRVLEDRTQGIEYLWQNLERTYKFRHVLSHSPRTRRTYLTAARVARSRAPVMIGGESGTGKEFLARAVHFLSDRAKEPLVVLNCGAFPHDLLESELFGHEKGAYTSAGSAKPGLVELAHGGTLFLDEIGDMSLPMQVKLLRFLQDGSFRRLGGSEERRVDVRLIAATNQDLALAIKERRFRDDLYWRLNVIPLYLPPLRERPEDIGPFSRHFLAQFAQDLDRLDLTVDAEALVRLRQYNWPGNIRQLHNVLMRAALLAPGSTLGAQHVVFDDLGE
ncbi:MAG TPA: sigma-54 dependent transcriptional regulator [Armatimonadota bacterium]